MTSKWFFLYYGVALAYLWAAPYTKVEESFNMQATHDIIYHGANLSQYDHKEFPGPVPRTFLGPLTLGSLGLPLRPLLSLLAGDWSHSRLLMQYAVRALLSALVCWSLADFTSAVSIEFGSATGLFGALINASQFHLLFYSSRALPNTFAMALCLRSLAGFVRNRRAAFVAWAGAAILLFRSELALLFGWPLLLLLATGRMRPIGLLKVAVPTAVACILSTVSVDSVFWGRPLWPELSVFVFNAVEQKSSQWGTQPALWYFYSALPRCLLLSLPLSALGALIDRRQLPLVACCVLFVACYSLLGHKELRFVLYAVPPLNFAAGAACAAIFRNRGKSLLRGCLRLLVVGHLVGNGLLSCLLAMASAKNYPGGQALMWLHDYIHESADAHVHICNLAAQTGATRFLQLHDNWVYNKTEGLQRPEQFVNFSHVIAEPEFVDRLGLTRLFRVMGAVTAFKGFDVRGLLALDWNAAFNTETALLIMERV